MTRKTNTLMILICLSMIGIARGQRPLDRNEILQIFQTVTAQPAKTWIPAGAIEAAHTQYRAPETTEEATIVSRIDQEIQEYREEPHKLELTPELQQMKLEAIPFNVRYELANEYTMQSQVIVRYDGNRFYWEINVISRNNSITPPVHLAGNSYLKHFNLQWNQKRIFCWDGQKYVTYFLPGNHAIITAQPGSLNGPLTAGKVPWGYGQFSYPNLAAAQSSAQETEVDGIPQINLTVTAGAREEELIMDPGKDYALKSWTTTQPNSYIVIRTYDRYTRINDNWCPARISMERFDLTGNSPKHIASDTWEFISIHNGAQPDESFTVDYEYDALIEDFLWGTPPLQYRYSVPDLPLTKGVDTEKLKAERLRIANSDDRRNLNCGILALNYVAGRLNANIPLDTLRYKTGDPKGNLSLYEVQKLANKLNISSYAAQVDINLLATLGDYEVILHLPQKKHFVSLGSIDENYVRLIDLSSDKFYYRVPVCRFASLWDGTALLLGNNNPPRIQNNEFRLLNDSEQHQIVGAGCGMQCNTKIQDSSDTACTQLGNGSCGGTHTIIYERWKCGAAASGNCTDESMVGSKEEVCIKDPNDPTGTSCVGNGEWTSTSIEACACSSRQPFSTAGGMFLYQYPFDAIPTNYEEKSLILRS